MSDIRPFPHKKASIPQFQCRYFLCTELTPDVSMTHLVEPAKRCTELLRQLLQEHDVKDGSIWLYELEDVRMILAALHNPLTSEQDQRRWLLLELQDQPDFDLYAIALDGLGKVLDQMTGIPGWEEIGLSRQLVLALNDLHDRIMTAMHPDGQALLASHQLVRGV